MSLQAIDDHGSTQFLTIGRSHYPFDKSESPKHPVRKNHYTVAINPARQYCQRLHNVKVLKRFSKYNFDVTQSRKNRAPTKDHIHYAVVTDLEKQACYYTTSKYPMKPDDVT